MDSWTIEPPPPSDLGDRQVPLLGTHLEGRRIALMVTGGIAAMKAPFIARALRRYGAEVVAFASQEGLRYVAEEALAWATVHPVITRLTAAAEHLSDDAPFDAYLVAPATYNTLNKMAFGIADTPVTTALASAIGRMERGGTKVLVAPTMHGTLHNAILTEGLERLVGLGVRIVPPREAYGKHNIPDTEALVAEVIRAVSRSPLCGRRALVTGGIVPLPIDARHEITSRSRGRPDVEIGRELFLRGAEVLLIHTDDAVPVPAMLPHLSVHGHQGYRSAVLDHLRTREHAIGVFAASVPDSRPVAGESPGSSRLVLDLEPMTKVVDEVRAAHQDLHMVSFEPAESLTREKLIPIVRERLRLFEAVVATCTDDVDGREEQTAVLATRNDEPIEITGNRSVATAIADHLERTLPSRARSD